MSGTVTSIRSLVTTMVSATVRVTVTVWVTVRVTVIIPVTETRVEVTIRGRVTTPFIIQVTVTIHGMIRLGPVIMIKIRGIRGRFKFKRRPGGPGRLEAVAHWHGQGERGHEKSGMYCGPR